MLTIRYSKLILLAAVSFYATLVAFGNITDYQTNFDFVQHVLMMDTIFPDATIKYRAINNPMLHHLFYLIIIITECVIAAAGWYGSWMMLCARKQSAKTFNHAKRWGVIALTLAFILWQVGFMSVGGEWFGMWMSKTWNGLNASFRIFTMVILILIYLIIPDRDEKKPESA
ncbi:DUF2165 domain-containing protein [Buttiauxella warmboldiae]|uniref:DUF2165 domain-containing protein n=1 Tax=Buttiauxella warmboldiae TaxID=82993 RepID=A0A3N5DR57_9ENTR|nr:DUF2165 domain-containing protein [Buttiauxella warmboldiae]